MRNILGDQGNMEQNFWEQGNSVKVNFREHLNFFLRNKETTLNFHREQGNMHPPWGALRGNDSRAQPHRGGIRLQPNVIRLIKQFRFSICLLVNFFKFLVCMP